MLCGNYILSNRSEWTFYFLSSVQLNFTISGFNLETTLNGSSKYFFNLITKAKNNGFKVHLYYVGLSSVYLALDRVKARVKKVAMEWMKI
ncbi:hypothetical protein IMAU10031_01440 [Lactobacillus helveticus]|nr:hypothetical protein [Lactobacillus helveticus]NRO39245.1 hypothetical protein [Lactobacillus helveticus]NRO76575.1 hypothetical protein [Lactobacillus helveticus]